MQLRNLLPVIALVILCSCEDKDHTPAPGIGGSMSAAIDGVNWAATSTYFNQPATNVIQFSGERNPTGTDPTAIGIQLKNFNGATTYILNGTSDSAYLFKSGVLYSSTTGQVNVTQSDDTWLKANFSFSATDSLNTTTKTVTGTFTYRKK